MYSYTLNGISVSPTGEWEIEYVRNEGQIFRRRYLRGDLTFRGSDYNMIMSMSDCDILEFIIFCNNTEHWVGQFKFPYDFYMDTDSCFLTGTPEVVDEYSCIMNQYEKDQYLPAMALGGVAPVLQTCIGGFLMNLGNCYRLGAPSGSGLTNYLDELINDSVRMNCGMTLRSSFLWRDDFANGDNYAAAFGTNNYVTGASNRLEYIFMYTNPGIRSMFGGTACAAGSSGYDYWTFKEFEDFLRNAFNAYWFIDRNGHFRIEHISYFLPGFAHSDYEDGIDLTALIGSTGKSYAYRRNKYKYLTDKLFDQEVWKWQYYEGTEGNVAHDTNFEGEPVYYGAAEGQKSDCVPGEYKEKEFNTPNFWSDIYWAYQLLAAGTCDVIDCKGWCFVDVDDPLGAPTIRCETGLLNGVNTINAHCSTANLQEHYHTWDRIFLNGTMNGNDATPVNVFDSAIKKRLQDEIEFPVCCRDEFDPLNQIVTHMGSGSIYSAIMSKNSLKTELVYD